LYQVEGMFRDETLSCNIPAQSEFTLRATMIQNTSSSKPAR